MAHHYPLLHSKFFSWSSCDCRFCVCVLKQRFLQPRLHGALPRILSVALSSWASCLWVFQSIRIASIDLLTRILLSSLCLWKKGIKNHQAQKQISCFLTFQNCTHIGKRTVCGWNPTEPTVHIPSDHTINQTVPSFQPRSLSLIPSSSGHGLHWVIKPLGRCFH